MAIKLGRNVQNRIILNMTEYHSFIPKASKVIKKTLVDCAPPRSYRVKDNYWWRHE